MIKFIQTKLSNWTSSQASNKDAQPLPEISEDIRIPTFIVGCGRSGTHFLAELFQQDHYLRSNHLDDVAISDGDSFLFYCEWNKLAVDHHSFIHHRRGLINRAGERGQLYVESNPYLALSIERLYQHFKAKFIFLHRQPHDVVASHDNKDWYRHDLFREDNQKAMGYQYEFTKTNHFFGRMIPNGDEYQRWMQLTRIGKIAWMWNITNLKILFQLEAIPSTQYQTIALNDLDYYGFLDVNRFVGGKSPLDKTSYEAIQQRKPGKRDKKRTSDDWSPKEWDEFYSETEPARRELGYQSEVIRG